eukprot:354646-Chlamydomonas_euryale.AAC.5
MQYKVSLHRIPVPEHMAACCAQMVTIQEHPKAALPHRPPRAIQLSTPTASTQATPCNTAVHTYRFHPGHPMQYSRPHLPLPPTDPPHPSTHPPAFPSTPAGDERTCRELAAALSQRDGGNPHKGVPRHDEQGVLARGGRGERDGGNPHKGHL